MPELLDHPAAGAGSCGMMEISTRCERDRLEGETQRHDDRFGHQPAAGQGLVDPVADERALERSPLDGRERDLAGEALTEEDAEPVAGAEVPLALADAAPGREAGRGPPRGPGRPWAAAPSGAASRRTGCAPRAMPGSRPRSASAGAPAVPRSSSGAWRTALAALIVRAPPSWRRATRARSSSAPCAPCSRCARPVPANCPAPAPISIP